MPKHTIHAPDPAYLVSALRDLDNPTAHAAAERLLTCYATMADVAATLETAAKLRAGMMDSESKAQEIQAAVRLALTSSAQTLRANLPDPVPLKEAI